MTDMAYRSRRAVVYEENLKYSLKFDKSEFKLQNGESFTLHFIPNTRYQSLYFYLVLYLPADQTNSKAIKIVSSARE
eukprot:403352116